MYQHRGPDTTGTLVQLCQLAPPLCDAVMNRNEQSLCLITARERDTRDPHYPLKTFTDTECGGCTDTGSCRSVT